MSHNMMGNDIFELNCISETDDGVSVLLISGHDPDSTKRIYDLTDKSFSLYELTVKNWDDYLTPWPADCQMKGRSFGGKGRMLLDEIESTVIPLINCRPLYIAGYSLAGLFSLWALYESEAFDGAACCSGSLWYPGWNGYSAERSIKRHASVYLSLGDREEHARHVLMKTVGDNMRAQYERLCCEDKVTTHFDMNEGGHFSDVDKRIAAGIKWLLGQ